MGKPHYDDGAFVFFLGTLLFMFVAPTAVYVVHRIVTYHPSAVVVRRARTAAENSKLDAITSEALAQRKNERLWSVPFITLAAALIVCTILLVGTIIVGSSNTSIAQYDPYTVSCLFIDR
jgi:ABC-type methionine transport system permease subunit